MEMNYIWAAAIFFGGWLWSYLFLRQLLFDLLTALPLIKKLRTINEDLIAVGASRYTIISLIMCIAMSILILAIVLILCPTYLLICFFVGAAAALLMLIGKLGPKNRPMFDAFCSSYCRVVPDDELRKAMFDKKPNHIKARLRAMGFRESFLPDFKD